MANLINLFPLTVYQAHAPLAPEEQAHMIAAVHGMADNARNNVPGAAWTGDMGGYEFLHQDPRFSGLFALFGEHLQRYLESLNLNPESLRLYYTRAWATLSQGKERISEHSHTQSHISLVYYLKKPPGAGGLAFVNNDPPNQIAPHIFNERMTRFGILKDTSLVNTLRANLDPGEGDVVIFPSKTRHLTYPNNGSEPRISIAVDIVLTVKNSAGLEHLLPDLDRWQAAY